VAARILLLVPYVMASCPSMAIVSYDQVEMYLAGAFCDEAGRGPQLASQLLYHFHINSSTHVTVKLLCCGEANTDDSGAPRTQSLTFCTATQAATCPGAQTYPQGASHYNSIVPSTRKVPQRYSLYL
jgi:hypothetical protein